MCVLTVEVLACQLLAVQLYVEAEQVLSSQQVLPCHRSRYCLLSRLHKIAFYQFCSVLQYFTLHVQMLYMYFPCILLAFDDLYEIPSRSQHVDLRTVIEDTSFLYLSARLAH